MEEESCWRPPSRQSQCAFHDFVLGGLMMIRRSSQSLGRAQVSSMLVGGVHYDTKPHGRGSSERHVFGEVARSARSAVLEAIS